MADAAQLISLTSSQVMAKTTPESFFAGEAPPTLDVFKLVMRKLLSHWHHMASNDSSHTDAFNHVKKMQELGVEKLEKNLWNSKVKELCFETDHSKVLINYLHKDEIPGWGTRFEGRSNTYHLISSSWKDLIEPIQARLKNLHSKAPTPELKSQFDDQAFGVLSRWNDATEKGLVRYFRPKGYINALDVKNKLVTIPVKHVAWMLSRLFNMACLMQHIGQFNLNIRAESVYINPEYHSVILVDGWQFVDGCNVQAAPEWVLHRFPDIKTTKKVESQIVLDMIKSTGLELLGDRLGVNLLRTKDVPEALVTYLLTPSQNDAIKEYAAYVKVRDQLFPRKFINWNLTVDDVYV